MSTNGLCAVLLFFAAFSGSYVQVYSYSCAADNECCANGRCLTVPGYSQKQCVISTPTDSSNTYPYDCPYCPPAPVNYQLCPACPFGYSYVNGVCTADSSPCNPNPCPSGQTCVYEPKYCFTTPCPQYKCVGEPQQQVCPPGQVYNSTNQHCECACQRPTPIENRNCTSCVYCTQIVPQCPYCPSGYECQLVPQTCTQCAYAQCVPKKLCVRCRTGTLRCPACPRGWSCRAKANTCTSCGYAYCVPPKKKCVICPYAPLICPKCPPGMQCKVINRTCDRCGYATCSGTCPSGYT